MSLTDANISYLCELLFNNIFDKKKKNLIIKDFYFLFF